LFDNDRRIRYPVLRSPAKPEVLIMRWTILLTVCALIGCDAKVATAPTPAPTPVAPTPLAPPAVAPVTPPVTTPPPTERVAAEVGVGAKGRDYGGGMITEPARQYWRVQERLTFDVQIKHAMDLYKPLHDDKLPATHDEFMKEIIEANNIKLPKLPPGEKYIYDPAKEELMVERPAPPK
jgi:hypothetical protein